MEIRFGFPFLAILTMLALPSNAASECFAGFHRVAEISGAWELTVADFNHDGFDDIAAVSGSSGNPFYTGSLNILLGKGDGSFLPVKHYRAAFGALGLATGDFDGDGNLDVLVVGNPEIGGSQPEGIDLFLGNGDGTFRLGSKGAQQARELNSAVVGDFNGDGNLDAVIGPYYSSYVEVFLGNGDGTMRGPFPNPPGSFGPWELATADFDNDGKLDLATINSSYFSRTWIYLGNGDGTFRLHVVIPTKGDEAFAGVTGDFNEDGNADLAIVNAGSVSRPGNVAVLLGKGNGDFDAAVTYPAPGVDLVTADFNGDGHLDLISHSTSLQP